MVKVSQFIPIFRSFGESKAKEFCVDYSGFKVTFEHRFEENAPLYFGVSLGEPPAYCEIHLSEHHGDTTPGSTVRIEVDDIQVFYDELQTKNYKYAKPEIQHQPWGFREVSIADPFGNKLIFCQPDESINEQRKERP